MTEPTGRRSGRLALVRENRALLVLVFLFLAFLSLSAVARSQWLLHWDHSVSLAVQRHRSSLLDNAAEAVSALGNTETLIALGAISATAFLRRNLQKAALLVALAVLGLPVNVAIKALVGRPRPGGDIQVILPALGLSFPSGHSMGSAMIFGTLAFLVWVHDQNPWRRRIAAPVLAVLPALIGVSRIYLGAHWLSDVIGGWTVGLFFLLLLAEGYKVLARNEVVTGGQEPAGDADK